MEYIINSLSHVVWVQILYISVTGIFAAVCGILYTHNKQLSRKVKDLQWTIKYLNRPQTSAETGWKER